MAEPKDRKIWKIRTVKNYPQAHNHLFIGEVLQQTQSYVRLNCRTYHFGRTVNSIKDVKIGSEGVRIIPWSRIEMINELASCFDYSGAEVIASKAEKMILSDGKTECVLSSSYDNKY